MYTQVKMTPEQKAFMADNLAFEKDVAGVMAQYIKMGFDINKVLNNFNARGVSDQDALTNILLSWKFFTG